MKYIVGTRGSRLSIIQTEEVLSALRRLYPGMEFEVKVIKTRGDIDLKTPLYKIPSKGIFEKELDRALLDGVVDFAVHSMKDYPTKTHEELMIAAVPPRRTPHDVFISRISESLAELPPGSRVGTSSLRRQGYVKYMRPDVEVAPIRGNVETRLRKMIEGEVEALILAEAGIERLGEKIRYQRLGIDEMTPPAGQGALAVVARREDEELLKLLHSVNDEKSMLEVTIEREIISMLNVGCKTPLGVHASTKNDGIDVTISTISTDYREKVYVNKLFKSSGIREITSEVVKIFREKGGDRILQEWRGKGYG